MSRSQVLVTGASGNAFHEISGMAIAMLRYHAFVPGAYLEYEYGARLLRNGVNRQDVVRASVATLQAALEGRVTLFRTIFHTELSLPPEVPSNFRRLAADWFETQANGAKALLEKYAIGLPKQPEQHDLSAAASVLGWRPKISFLEFPRDLRNRDSRGEDVGSLIVPGELPAFGRTENPS